MRAIHIREVPDEVVDALKRRAARNERSLQGELRHILRDVASNEPKPAPQPLDLTFSQENPQSSWSREEIYGDDER